MPQIQHFHDYIFEDHHAALRKFADFILSLINYLLLSRWDIPSYLWFLIYQIAPRIYHNWTIGAIQNGFKSGVWWPLSRLPRQLAVAAEVKACHHSLQVSEVSVRVYPALQSMQAKVLPKNLRMKLSQLISWQWKPWNLHPLKICTYMVVNWLYLYCVYITSDTDVQNQPQESSTIILLICFAIVVVVSVMVITILTIVSVKRRRNVPSKNDNTQYYIKPPTGDCNLNAIFTLILLFLFFRYVRT